MDSLSGPHRQDALIRIGLLCELRRRNWPEEEIAKKLEFGGTEAMHTQLKNWDLTGLLPKEAERISQQPKQRKAKAGTPGASMELPRPDRAGGLFEEVVEALHETIEDLEHYRLVFENGRFTNTWVDNETPTYFPRSSFTSEQWDELCKTHGRDANSNGFMLHDSVLKVPSGGGRYPPRPLVNLIAVYALLGRDMSALLKVLNRDPSDADKERISGLIYKTKDPDGRDGLVRTAEQLAELVFGGGGRRGAPAGDLSEREQNVACSITEYRDKGWSDAELCKHYAPLGFSRERVLELGKLGLRWPED